MKNLKKGFTLVELIVVITILAVLATIAFITLGDYPMKTRDTKRISQVGTIFDKMKILSATKFQTFVKNTTGNDDKPLTSKNITITSSTPANTILEEAEGEVNFVTLGEEISKFTTYNGTNSNSGDVYKVKAVKYYGADKQSHYCHSVGVKGEVEPQIIKSDCPGTIKVTL
ncbi:hypothetical protein DLH72_03885 [Candidatus Gracilibacteria bacterium]|nr:MAG: hypothetical protein DLH72_03885 [Candidatus Gracilibacteria bacterium]